MKELESVLNPQIILYSSQQENEEVFHENDLVELFSYGLSLGDQRPFLLLKDKDHMVTLPVAINPLEAGIILSQLNKGLPESSPHQFLYQYLKGTGAEIVRAVFVQIKGSHQFVRLYIVGVPQFNSIKVRSEEAMSLCLYLKVPIFATREFIGKSKVMSLEVEKNSKTMSALPEMMNRGTSYLN